MDISKDEVTQILSSWFEAASEKLTELGISVRSQSGEVRSMYDILKEISEIYNSLEDEDE